MKRWLLIAGAAFLLLAIGYGLGRYAQPAKIVEKTHETVRTVTEVQYKDRVVVQTQIKYLQAKAIHEVCVEVKKPDGTVTTTKTTDTATSVKAAEGQTSEKIATGSEVAHTETAKDTVTTITSSKPQWLIGAGASLSFSGVPAYGGEIDRRILGPIFVGVTADSAPRLGLALKLEL